MCRADSLSIQRLEASRTVFGGGRETLTRELRFQEQKAARLRVGFSVVVGRNYCILRSGGTMGNAVSPLACCAVPALTIRATSIQNGPTGMWAYFLRA